MKRTCVERMGEWRTYPCGKPAKWKVVTGTGEVLLLCGIHVRRYRRWDQSRITIEALA